MHGTALTIGLSRPARIVLTFRTLARSKVFDVSFLGPNGSLQPRFYRREQFNPAHCIKLTVDKRGGCTGDSVDQTVGVVLHYLISVGAARHLTIELLEI